MSNRSRRQSEKSNNSKMDESTKSTGYAAGLTEMEYFWSIELNADKRSFTWMKNDDMEDGDEDFIEYTLFLKSALLGANAVPNEYNILMLESAGSDGEPQKGAIANLCLGQNNMTTLDMSVSGKVGPTTFTLAEGSGPIYISGNQLMEFPKEDSLLDASQTESEEEELEEEDIEEINGNEEEVKKSVAETKKAPKRKAGPIAGKPKQKPKMDQDEEEDEIEEDDEDEDDEDEEEEEEESEEEESEEEVKLKKSKKGKNPGKKETPKSKVSKKPAKKGKK